MKSKTSFLDTLFGYYDLHGRDLPWRQTTDPYKIMVSELMLQQTQVQRVIPKYEAFIKQFPEVETLAKTELATVLRLWSGLGYNRRAKFLHESAKQLAKEAQFPRSIDELVALPGVGKNTAGAILVYAFDVPHVFIETNVRSCLFEHFFQKVEAVTDKQLEEILKELLPLVESPRYFYWAMMDYGTYLKKQKNNIQKSKHYAKQTPFEGSKRQIRGRVLRLLGQKPRIKEELQEHIADNRVEEVVVDLIKEGLIREDSGRYSLG